MDQRASKQHAILNYLFSAIVVVALIVIYLLTGQRTASTDAEALTPAASPTATPFGRPPYALAADLALYAISAEPTEDGYLLAPEGVDKSCATCTLTLSLSEGTTAGFVLSFPVVPQPDVDDSAISAALQKRAAEETALQAGAMEDILQAVLSAFDTDYALPATVRSAWCAQFLSLQNDPKSAGDDHGRFHFSVYPSGSGDAMRLCCAVLYE